MLSYKKRTRSDVERLFSQIASTYDRNNALLSFGLFKRWNRALVESLPKGAPLLDLCAGTGEIAFAHYKREKTPITLLDFCQEMLDIAKAKGPEGARYICGDAHEIPLDDASMEAVSCAYGIRNLIDPVKCGKEVYRVLKPGGTFGILELTRPASPLIATFHHLHVRALVPLIGKLFSPSKAAYTYLSESVQKFTDPHLLAPALKEVGFAKLKIKPLFWGSATLILLTK